MLPPSAADDPATATDLIIHLTTLRSAANAFEAQHEDMLAMLPGTQRESARNLLHYLALRQHDIRDVQDQLGELGLSRLGRAEAHTLASLDAVLDALHAMVAAKRPRPTARRRHAIAEGARHLADNAAALLGPAPTSHATRIMVTAPSEAAREPRLLADLLAAGMNVLRINTAHDDADAWLAMVANLRAAQRASGLPCRIHVDLAGPKLRTGDIEPVGRLAEFKPLRDPMGGIVAPARIWLTPREHPQPAPEEVEAVLPIDAALLVAATADDHIDVVDARGSRRHLQLERRIGESWLALCQQHAYVTEGADCTLFRGDTPVGDGHVGVVPDLVLPITLRVSDRLRVTRESEPGHLPTHDSAGRLLAPASIPCTLPAAFSSARCGQAIWFDDGKIGGRIAEVQRDALIVEITHAAPRGGKLRPGKGINLPDTDLDTPSLTLQDRAALEALAPHADIIGLSFVRCAQDIRDLHAALAQINAPDLAVVAKIESRQGFMHLPEILLAGMGRPPFGVMVARGDLAVEVGFERLSEVQEEIVWLCEAAHVPVIWATQVLENMARRGLPSRAEVSDAAHAARAECVMLNKGPYIVDATRFLAGVLARMAGHKDKRAPMLRRLSVSVTALETVEAT